MEDKEPLWADLMSTIKETAQDVKNKSIETLKDKQIDNDTLRKGLAAFMIFCILAMGFTGYKINEIRTRAFDLYIKESKIGNIRNKKTLDLLISDLESELSEDYGVDIVLGKDINLETAHVKNSGLTDINTLRKEIKERVDILVAGCAISIDGEQVGVLSCTEDAKAVIKEIGDSYIKDSETRNILETTILEDIQYLKKEVPLSQISNKDELIDYIKNGGEEIKTHTIEVGENFWTIAKIYNTTMEELEDANPERDPLKLRPGDEIKLVMPASKITVQTVEEVEYTSAINFDVKVENDSSMYTNQNKIKIQGQRGESKVVAKEIKENGVLSKKEILKEEVIKEPIDQVVVKGTKEVPKTVATGSFLMPTRGRLTSSYGSRWGRMHYGLDISASTGTAIKAADGGTISFAGWQGSYGNMVEINHGNGYKTRYAHCSKINVKTGQKVYKGQTIANVGNTGRSTGPHLYFEVLKNGVNVNPSNFVK